MSKPQHIVLRSHRDRSGTKPLPIYWGEIDPLKRGPVIGSLSKSSHRNAIGTHSGSYSVYRALAVANGALQADHRPDFTNTSPTAHIGPHPSWGDRNLIVSLDPFGGLASEIYTSFSQQGYDIRPTIAVTKAHINMPELQDAIAKGRVQIDGKIVKAGGNLAVTKIAIDPVWYLPGIAERIGVEESLLRRVLFEQTGGMFSDLVTRSDLHVFLPPIGGTTVYIIGDVANNSDRIARV